MIRNVHPKDSEEIANIYNYYINNTIVTFEESQVMPDDIKEQILLVTQKLPWIVYEEGNKIIGYAYASEWKSRCAYKYSVETTVYLKHKHEGKGIGTLLYIQLIDTLKELGFHALIGGISLPNEASIALHEKIGVQKDRPL